MIKFRSQPLNQLSAGNSSVLIYEKIIFERRWNSISATQRFQCQEIKHSGKRLVNNKITKLTWQQSGSSDAVTYNQAKKYIHDLNKQKFAGYNDWRFPTLDEAMSLLKPRKSDNGLYIDSAFDQKQKWIWTLEESDAEVPWVVTFRAGCCYVPSDTQYYVRAVRGEFWVPGDESPDMNA